jgi:hypothetical protein
MIVTHESSDAADEAVNRAFLEHSAGAPDQVKKLADFIINHVPGEPSRSEPAVDTAIRLIKERLAIADDAVLGELEAGGLFHEIGRLAKEHSVTVTLTVYPHDESDED